MTTSVAPASTGWLSITATCVTVPPTRGEMGATCASTWASSVDCCPAVVQSHAPTPSTTTTTAMIPMRIRVFIRSNLQRRPDTVRPPYLRRGTQVPLDFFFRDAQRPRQHRLRHQETVTRVDELFVRDGDGLLRLNDLDVAGDTRLETVTRLRELLRGEVAPLRCGTEHLAR